jgi:Uma2 family endonuclease
MSVKTLLTVDQFLELPQVRDDDYRRYELWQGELVEMGETIPFHNWIRDLPLRRMGNFVEAGRLGVVLCETAFRLDSNTLYRPDLAFSDTPHWESMNLRKSGGDVVPQLVVEVQSPSESRASVLRKAADYQRAGIHTTWAILENPYEVHVFEAGRKPRLVLAGQKLEAPGLLPGFSIDPSDLLPL